MIRFIIGLILVMGNVDNEEFTIASTSIITIGLIFVVWAGLDFRAKDETNYKSVQLKKKSRRRQ